jgi:hypothetical protein
MLSPAYGAYAVVSIPDSILNVPGLLGFAALARLDRAVTPWGDAGSFDYPTVLAVALFSCLIWSAFVGFCFRSKKRSEHPEPHIPFLAAK